MNRPSGFTLIEMLVTLAIAAILMGSMFPSLNAMLERSRATSSINWIVSAVNFTRHAAIVHRNTMTICAPKIGDRCGGNWHRGLIVFSDRNKNARMDGNDKIVARINPPGDHGTLKWRAFRNRQYLQMTQMGYTNFQNGNFVYCPHNQDRRFARQLIINVQGRTRLVHKKDSDGIPIDRKGHQLRC